MPRRYNLDTDRHRSNRSALRVIGPLILGLGVLLTVIGTEPYTVHHGDRIAQAIISPVVQAGFELATSLDATKRGTGGFGSTGRS